ncbi:AraC family transcriptional regulator [Nocardia coubleae]|uniref:AraC family transcriptional regulator n=1 Tax=Nocardia coubleae TaxID=356147 RepID=A0A846WD61_9NOCA|nr:AraC family transcriptional regulator [Nocardia coubleae]NKX90713.1 AraC family transcriptional regulator [Nocardia coubleae]
MDALAGLLEGPRARGAFLMCSLLDPPWSLRVQDQAPLTVLAMIRGKGWVSTESGSSQQVGAGDVVIFRGPQPYTVSDDPATEPQIVVQPGQVTTTPDGEILCETLTLGIRQWGTDPDGETLMVTGTYESAGAVSTRLLRALPQVAVLPRGDLDSRLLDLLVDEATRDRPAQGAVLDRLLDLLLIAALRAWFARDDAPAWYHAYSDPLVGKALRLLQHNPAHPWTVVALADAVGMSRAALARRFTELVGEPPMTFLTEWRLSLAADLLAETDSTVESIARQVGYGSAFALSTAFKRHFGVSPRDHRQGGGAALSSSA